LKFKKYIYGLICLIIFIYPHIITSSYLIHISIIVFTFAILSLSFDILARTGQVSVGHAALFGIGAYSAVLFFNDFGIPNIFSIILGGFVTSIISIFLGLVTLRMKGIYFSIATLCFAEALKVFALIARPFTGGAIGISVEPLFNGNIIFSYYFILLILIVSILIAYKIDRSKLKFAFAAIRENEILANVSGINPTKFKIFSFAISAFFAGLAGGFYAFYITYIIPYEIFSISISVECLVMPIFGGLYSIEGPILGAIILKSSEEFLRTALPYGHMVVYGIILVISVLFMPTGLIGLLKKYFKKK
jgi:branched-chain amino acid transport system permease protein